MPLYEYECERGHRFERIVKFSDPPLEVCPECGAVVHKLMSSPAIQFKGSGFYITDYAQKGKSESSGEGGGSSEKKTETAKSDSATKSDAPASTSTPSTSTNSSKD